MTINKFIVIEAGVLLIGVFAIAWAFDPPQSYVLNFLWGWIGGRLLKY